MARVTVTELAAALEGLQAQIAEISLRMQALEGQGTQQPAAAAVPSAAAVPAPLAAAAPPVRTEPAPAAVAPVKPEITEEEMLAIAAAIGAYLGVRAHIRQIRLLSTSAWAQQGRVSIQASHTLQG